MGFSRQEYWSGLLFPPPGDLPDPGIKYESPELQADSLLSEEPGKPNVLILHSFLWLNKIVHYLDRQHFIYSSADGHLDCFIFGYVSWILNHVNVLVLFIQNKYTRLKNNQKVTSFKKTSLISQSRVAPTLWAHCWFCPPPSTRI